MYTRNTYCNCLNQRKRAFYLESKYLATSSSKYVCEFCGFTAKNAAAKSAHLRGCSVKKSQLFNDNATVITIEK